MKTNMIARPNFKRSIDTVLGIRWHPSLKRISLSSPESWIFSTPKLILRAFNSKSQTERKYANRRSDLWKKHTKCWRWCSLLKRYSTNFPDPSRRIRPSANSRFRLKILDDLFVGRFLGDKDFTPKDVASVPSCTDCSPWLCRSQPSHGYADPPLLQLGIFCSLARKTAGTSPEDIEFSRWIVQVEIFSCDRSSLPLLA